MSDYDKEVLTASALLARLDAIEARIETMSNTQDKMWEYLDEVEDHVMMPWNFTELMEDQNGID
jgi:arsenate reductase-like glutaredoxin family protein